jgi:hypothetical protein
VQEGDPKIDREPSEDRQTWFTTTEDHLYKRDVLVTEYDGSFERSSQYVRNFIEINVSILRVLAIYPL